MHSIGSEIKKIRSEHKLSQEEFAERINQKLGFSITKGMVSKWESDSIEPKTRMIKAIAETFHVSLDEMLGLSVSEKSSPVETIAAHIDDDLTEEELAEIKRYIQFIKSQRK
ncbi:helix-turn-helix domain-containing protein [Sporosarcina sp. UB5]|uniref:helix-turn-helix domain-containing protein n=1 Tax=Sporosarcina sp. UB5 TaxID=3047463 RepID=UPI003D7A9F24